MERDSEKLGRKKAAEARGTSSAIQYRQGAMQREAVERSPGWLTLQLEILVYGHATLEKAALCPDVSRDLPGGEPCN